MRRDRAARTGPELFLYERAFADCLERIELMQRRFARALLIGCPDPGWPERLRSVCEDVDVRDPGELFAQSARGSTLVEDAWLPPEQVYDLVLAVGTLDTVNDLPLALRLSAMSCSPAACSSAPCPAARPCPASASHARRGPGRWRRRAPRPSPDRARRTGAAADRRRLANPVVDIDRVACLTLLGHARWRSARNGPTNVLYRASALHRQDGLHRGHRIVFRGAAAMGGSQKRRNPPFRRLGRPASLQPR